MTQDPYGQSPGSGYVVRGEVVPDDEADSTSDTPMTRFQKVASALRGDRTDPAIPVQNADQPPAGQTPDPNGTWPHANQAAGTTTEQSSETAGDAGMTHPEEVGAVRSPDDSGRDYWDEGDEEASPERTAATVPPTMEAVPPPDPAAAQAATMSTRPDGQDSTMTQPEPGVAGAAEAGVAGKHAGAPAAEGLRPGETDQALGDFGDLTYGSLLPDVSEFTARWQQVQFRFVDDPQGSVTEAADVISQITAKLEAAIAERQRAIAERQRMLRGRWSEGKSTDTESLRETLLMYRAFMDQLTGPKTG